MAEGRSERSEAWVQIKARLRPDDHAQLMAAAKANGYPLNTELTRRVSQSLRDEGIARAMFRDHEMFLMIQRFVRVLQTVEHVHGKPWTDNNQILLRAIDIFRRLTEITPLVLRGEMPERFHDTIDLAAFRLLEAQLQADIARRSEEDRRSAREDEFLESLREVAEELHEANAKDDAERAAIREIGDEMRREREEKARARLAERRAKRAGTTPAASAPPDVEEVLAQLNAVNEKLQLLLLDRMVGPPAAPEAAPDEPGKARRDRPQPSSGEEAKP